MSVYVENFSSTLIHSCGSRYLDDLLSCVGRKVIVVAVVVTVHLVVCIVVIHFECKLL